VGDRSRHLGLPLVPGLRAPRLSSPRPVKARALIGATIGHRLVSATIIGHRPTLVSAGIRHRSSLICAGIRHHSSFFRAGTRRRPNAPIVQRRARISAR